MVTRGSRSGRCGRFGFGFFHEQCRIVHSCEFLQPPFFEARFGFGEFSAFGFRHRCSHESPCLSLPRR